MGRKCSHCGNIGHNSRTCANYRGNVGIGGPVLFGVRLDAANCSSNSPPPPPPSTSSTSIKKSFSMECLSSITSSSPSSSSSLCSSRLSTEAYSDKASAGYLSDGLFDRVQERKKGVAWTEGEHMAFLVGLEKLGKGDWRGISRHFVASRTPTQVASHAQKYFLRLTSHEKKKRRSSLFDMVGSSNGSPRSSSKPASHPRPIDDHNLNFRTRNIAINPKDYAHDHHHDRTLPLLGLSSSQERDSHDQLMMLPGFGEFQLLHTSSITINESPNIVPPHDDDDDDLKLTLRAPSRAPATHLEGNRSPSNLLITRPIRVAQMLFRCPKY